MLNQEVCPKCGRESHCKRKNVIYFRCDSRADVSGSWFNQSCYCKYDLLLAQMEKLESFVKTVKQANDGESGMDGFEKKVLDALDALEKTNA